MMTMAEFWKRCYPVLR